LWIGLARTRGRAPEIAFRVRGGPAAPTAGLRSLWQGASSLNEKSLHAALKTWYAQPGDRFEVKVEGFVVDIVRGDLLIEIQTANFFAIRPKLTALTAIHPVRLIYPIAQEKWIVRQTEDGTRTLSRRKSPKRAGIEEVFSELVSLPSLLANPNFTIEVLLIKEEEVRRHDATRRWRRGGWVTHERRLLEVVGQRGFQTPADVNELLPSTLVDPFTTHDLAAAIGRPRRLAQRMTYCLREMGLIQTAGKRGRALLYTRTWLGSYK
jgi:hypothetical protein